MTTLLYGTVWASLAAFVAGEAARRASGNARTAVRLHTIGILLMTVHMAVSMGWVHDWSHTAAMAATAAQSKAVYGVDARAGLFVNYLFLIVWAIDAWHLRAKPDHPRLGRTGLLVLRAFYLIVIVNAAVVFAADWRRWLGAAMAVGLVGAWGRRKKK